MFFIAMALLLMGLPLFAAVQNIRVSGDISVHGISRWGYERPYPGVDRLAGVDVSTEGRNWYQSTARVGAYVDLTDNVEGVIRLLNRRDWGGVEERTIDIELDLAYVTLKEVLYSPLTLKMGRQNIVLGEGFVLGQNRIETALHRIPDPRGEVGVGGIDRDAATVDVDDDVSSRKAFDAITAVLLYEPWTIDLILAKLAERPERDSKDADLYGVNVGYKFDEYDAEVEGYLLNVHNRLERPLFRENIAVAGIRGSTKPADGWLLKGEYARQFGTTERVGMRDLDRRAFATNVGAEYTFEGEYTPKLGAALAWFSGDNNPRDHKIGSWNPFFEDQTWGSIVDYIYGNSNLKVAKIGGSIIPIENITLGASLYHFQADETAPGVNKRIGEEVNLIVRYAYTEDVTFRVLGAWFIPDDYVRDVYAAEFGVPRARVSTTDAFQLVGGVTLVF